jgi:seryl-tRNA synthetase
MSTLSITLKALSCAKELYKYKSLKSLCSFVPRDVKIPEPELDVDYLCNVKYKSEIEENIKHRKGVGNIGRVLELHSKLQNDSLSEETRVDLLKEFKEEAKRIPNKTCPLVALYGDNPKIIKVIGKKIKYNFQPKEFSEITKTLHLMRTDNLSNLSGHKSYYFMGELAEMEQALVRFTIENLLSRKFQLISVPDILPSHIIESCGMSTKGERTQVYGMNCVFLYMFGMLVGD